MNACSLNLNHSLNLNPPTEIKSKITIKIKNGGEL